MLPLRYALAGGGVGKSTQYRLAKCESTLKAGDLSKSILLYPTADQSRAEVELEPK